MATCKRYQQIATMVYAIEQCRQADDRSEWLGRHIGFVTRLVKDTGPSGSGFDRGTKIDLERSKPERLIFVTAFHHMNEAGYYDGWTEHDVIVRPSLVFEVDVRVTGRNRNDIKDLIAESFDDWLRSPAMTLGES